MKMYRINQENSDLLRKSQDLDNKNLVNIKENNLLKNENEKLKEKIKEYNENLKLFKENSQMELSKMTEKNTTLSKNLTKKIMKLYDSKKKILLILLKLIN